jgi:hypothetical protein
MGRRPQRRGVRCEPTEMNTFEVNGHKDCRFEKHRRLGGFTPSARRKNLRNAGRTFRRSETRLSALEP